MSVTRHIQDYGAARVQVPRLDPLAPREAPNYDPSMPCFDMEGVAQLARSFGVNDITAYTVKRETLAGKLKAHKVSNRLRYSEDDVRVWLRGMVR